MKFGFALPFGDVQVAAEFAREAENAGWDGFFVGEPVGGIEGWISLAASSMCTSTIKLGTMVTPLAKVSIRRLVNEALKIQKLANDRLILCLGAGWGARASKFTLPSLTRDHARLKLEKDLGKRDISIFERSQGLKIWGVGVWPNDPSMEQVVHYDGIIPVVVDERRLWRTPSPLDVMAITTFIQTARPGMAGYDVVVEGELQDGDWQYRTRVLTAWKRAGATWWVEAAHSVSRTGDGLKELMRRVREGPPNLA